MKKTLTEKLYFDLSSAIMNGEIKEGKKLPSLRRMADEKGIGINTVKNTYSLLLSEGFIYAKERSGYYVSSIFTQERSSEFSHMEEERGEKKEGLNILANRVDDSLFPYSTLRHLYHSVLRGSLLSERGENYGEKELRSAISDYVLNHKNIKTNSSNVVLGNGSSFFLLFLSIFFGEKPTFIIENPCYLSTKEALLDSNSNLIPVSLDEEGIDIKEVKKRSENINGNVILIISPSHQYPTGITMSAQRRSEILAWVNEKDNRYIVEDDYDSVFRYIGHSIPPLASLNSEKVIYMGSFSRTLTPALRMSFIILPSLLATKYKEKFASYPCSVSRIDQKVIALFMSEGHYERHIRRMKRVYRERRDKMLSLLREKIPDLIIRGEDSGLHFVIKKEGMDEKKVVNNLKEQGVLASNSSDGYLIVGYAHLKDNEIEIVAEKIKNAIFLN